jgi:low affinity Fe/Cu permease
MSWDFSRIANWCSETIGTGWFFITSALLSTLSMFLPQYYDFSINLISVVTFLIAILIQRTQNEQETRMEVKIDGINEKLDELIRSIEGADDMYRGIEKGKLR